MAMNNPVRQVPSWMACSADPVASPATPAMMLHVSDTAGTTVRLATAKAPVGAGPVAAAGHVVAPALSCDGPGTISTHRGWCGTGPDSDTIAWYRPLKPSRGARRRATRVFLPASRVRAPLLERTRGDRPRRLALCRLAGARSGVGRDVSLLSEPAPHLSSPSRSGTARSHVVTSRNRREFVAWGLK